MKLNREPKKMSSSYGFQNPQNKKEEKDVKEEIQKKAYEFYQERGCVDGHDWDDWLEAEKIVKDKKF